MHNCLTCASAFRRVARIDNGTLLFLREDVSSYVRIRLPQCKVCPQCETIVPLRLKVCYLLVSAVLGFCCFCSLPYTFRYMFTNAPQPTKSTWVYTSAASCSVCCTKAGSIQRISYKRGESSELYRKGRFIYRKERFEPRLALATLQRSALSQIIAYVQKLFSASTPTY